MAWKTLLAFGIGLAIGFSPLRDSKLADIIIAITGG